MTKKKDTLNKMAGTSWHVGYLHKKESDPRRHQSRCRYYNKKKGEKAICAKNFGNCHGSAHCSYYDEGPEDYTYETGSPDKGTPVISTIPFKGVKQIPIDKIEVSANAVFPKREKYFKSAFVL